MCWRTCAAWASNPYLVGGVALLTGMIGFCPALKLFRNQRLPDLGNTEEVSMQGQAAVTTMRVAFCGGVRFDVASGTHTLVTDQPVKDGGSDAGMSPVELFVGSLGSCVAYFVGRYCARHHIPCEGFTVDAGWSYAEQPHRIGSVEIKLNLPAELTSDQRDKLLKIAHGCTVHQSLVMPPKVEIHIAASWAMNYKRWFIGITALWVVTMAAAGYFFVKGRTIPAPDGRTAVVLSEAERNQILTEMRQLLKSVHGVLQGFSSQDLDGAGRAAKAAGMAMAADVNPALMAKLPLAFKAMGMSVHRDFDALADGIHSGERGEQVLKRLSDLIGRCAACHELYRVSSSPWKRGREEWM